MTCARRPAGARKPDPSTSAGSRRPDPRTGRARARRLSLLPVLALLLSALSLFAPATAEARTTLWSGTLTVGTGSDEAGCGSSTGSACSAQLTTDTVTLEGTAYVITIIAVQDWAMPPQLRLAFTRKVPQAGQRDELPGPIWRKLTLQVDGKSFDVPDSIDSSDKKRFQGHVTWINPGFSWTSGQQVQARLFYNDQPSVPRNVRASVGDNQVTLNWDAPSSWGDGTPGGFQIEWKPTNLSSDNWTPVNGADFEYQTEPNVFSFVLSGEQKLEGRDNRFIGTHSSHPFQEREVDLRVRAISANPKVTGDWVEVTAYAAAPPLNLRVNPGNGQLSLSWTAPLGTVTGYDVHYTSVLHRGVVPDTWPALDNPLGNKPVAGWVALPRSGTAASQTISSLDPGTAYRVRVRLRSGAGVSDWVFGTGTTSGTAPVPPSATFTVDEGAGFVGCSNDSASTLANCNFPPFTLEGTKYTITSLTSYTSVSPNELLLVVSPTLSRSDWEKLTLYIDGNSFRPVDSIDFGNALTGITWRNPGFRWAEGQQVKVRLTDDPPDPPTVSLSASPNPVDEGSPVTVTATLSQALSEDVRIPVYSAAAGSFDITIPAGQTTVTHEFTAPQLEDGEMKQYQIAIEWWRVLKSTPLDIKGSQSIAGVTVLDRNADPHTVSVSDASGTEMANGYPRLCFAFTLNRAAPHRIWVGYRTENGTATAGQDYQGVVGSPVIPFEPGETRKRKCISIRDDSVEDSGETFSVVLVNPHGAILGDARGTGTIYNHESTSLSALIVEGAATEDGPFTALDIGTFAPGTTAYGVTVPHGTTHVRLRPKASNSNLTITTGLDGKGESPVSSGQAGPAVALAVGDNVLVVKTEFNGQHQTYRTTVTRQAAAAVAVSLSATPNPVGEGSPVTVRATLTAALLGDVTIPLSTRRDTSEEGDHGALAAITVPAGFTSATGRIRTREDDDGEDETFTLSLGSLPTGLTAGATSSVQVTITKQQSTDTTTTSSSDTPTTTSSSDTPTTSSSDTTTSSSGVSTTASGPDGETLLVGFGQIAQTPPEVSIALDGAAPISEGEAARFRVSRTGSTTAPLSVNLEVRENQAEGQDFVAVGNEGNKILTIPAGQDSALYTVTTDNDDMDEANGSITVTVETGTGYTLPGSDDSASVDVHDNDAPAVAPPTEEKRAWHVRFGRTVSQQVVDALQQRFSTSTTTPSGLQLTVAGEALTGDTPLEENHVLLSRLLGFESVSSQELAQGSSFSFSPEGAGPRLSFWGKGAFSSFNGIEDTITLTGDVTTALVGAEWSNERWRAGAALSHSWGNGSYQGEGDGADGRISSSLTGIFPYGRYALTPRLGVWATAGYGWGNITLNPDGDAPEYNPATTMALGAVGMDGLLLDGGREGITLTTTADALFLKTGSEAVEGLASSEGNITRLRLGLEATRPFPLANGASLSPSLEVGLRQDSGDAETGFGMDLGAGLSWNDPERGITAAVKGRTLLSHGAEDFQDQGLALSFSWQPSPSNRGASLSLSHAVGLPAEGGLAALLNPTAIEVLDEPNSSGERFEARLAYGFPFYNDRLTLTPAVATALSTSSRTYSLLWSVAPYAQQAQDDPWQLSLEGERQENLSFSSAVDHSLKLRFALNL